MEHATPAILLLMVLFVGPVIYYIWVASKGKDIYIRRIPGIDAIDEAIGRAVELGRPISFTTGLTGIGPLLYACLGTLKHVAYRAARFGSRLFIPCVDPEALVITEATVQNAYRAANRFSSFDPDSIRFLSGEQFAFASGYMGLIHREKVAGAFLFGRYAAESLILAEAGQQVGAVQVAATTSAEQIPFFISACDYTLLGEELYAAGAFLSGDPVQRGSLRGQDIAKLVILVLILIGISQATYRSISTGTESSTEPLPLSKFIRASWAAVLGSEISSAPETTQ